MDRPDNNVKVSPQDVLDAMERWGGGFVSALAVAWRRADYQNQKRLRQAFGHYWDTYEEMVAGLVKRAVEEEQKDRETSRDLTGTGDAEVKS